MIHGETTHTDGRPILNVRWPQRGLYHVVGYAGSGQEIDVYDWDDNEGDAVESAMEHAGAEGEDDSEVNVYVVHGKDREAIKRVTDRFNMTGNRGFTLRSGFTEVAARLAAKRGRR